MDYRPSNLSLVPNVVIAEGKNDFYVLNYFETVLQSVSDPLRIVPGMSSHNLENLISLYLGWGKNFVVLLDSDRSGKEQKQRYLDSYGISLSERIYTYDDIDEKWSNNEIEDLFSKSDLLAIQSKCYPLEPKFNKKLFNRSVQELYVKNERFDLSEETIRNLNKVVEFLRQKLE